MHTKKSNEDRDREFVELLTSMTFAERVKTLIRAAEIHGNVSVKDRNRRYNRLKQQECRLKKENAMAEQKMTTEKMEASPELAAGSYGDAFWFQLFMRLIETKFPGASVFIEKAAELLPWAKLSKAIFNALADWQENKNFLVILHEMLAEWVEIDVPVAGPIRMMMKPDA